MSCRGFGFLCESDLIRSEARVGVRPGAPGWGGALFLSSGTCSQGHVYFICSISLASLLIACIISSPACAQSLTPHVLPPRLVRGGFWGSPPGSGAVPLTPPGTPRAGRYVQPSFGQISPGKCFQEQPRTALT